MLKATHDTSAAANLNGAPDGERMSDVLHGHLGTLERACARLEQFADNLPVSLRQQGVDQMLSSVYDALARAHRFEEGRLHPQMVGLGFTSTMTFERLRREHIEDRAFVEELQDAFADYQINPNLIQANQIGYMLRGFFEGMRRHIAFEREHVLPILRSRGL
ncbi:MAG: hemerythrin domain-containing protein [Pseudomonadota bacterium]